MIDRQESKDLAAAAEGRCPSCNRARPDLSIACPNCGSPPLGPADPSRGDGTHRRTGMDALMQVRSSDIEPYVGLGYLSKLFKVMAIILVLVLVAEVVTGLLKLGRAAIPTLLSEMSRLVVFAGLLWGAGDLALLVIDIGHDLRATRILIGRLVAHHVLDHPGEAEPRPSGAVRSEPR